MAGQPGKIHRSPKEKFEAVQLYLLLGGNVSKTAGALKISPETIWTWKKTDWWHEYEAQIRREENLELSARLKRSMNKAMELIEDRLDHGDWIYDQKVGKMVRKPVSLKDAQKTVVEFIDKREKLVENQQLTIAAEQIDDKLKKLADAFAKLSTPQINVTDVVFVQETADNENAVFVEETIPSKNTEEVNLAMDEEGRNS